MVWTELEDWGAAAGGAAALALVKPIRPAGGDDDDDDDAFELPLGAAWTRCACPADVCWSRFAGVAGV